MPRKRLSIHDYRTYRFKATPDQIWAFDTEYLRRRADALRPMGRHYMMRIRLNTVCFYVLLIAAAAASIFLKWWMVFTLIGLACLQRQANSRLAGELAAEAASASTDMFLHLYNVGALSIEEAPNQAALEYETRASRSG